MSSPMFDEVTNDDLEDIPENMLRAREILIWKKGSANQERVDVTDFESTKREVSVRTTRDPDFKSGDSVMVNFTSLKRQYFTTAKIKSLKDRHIILTISAKVYRCEQRSNFRFNSSPEFKIYVEMNNEKFIGIDLSAGGMAIEIYKDQKERFMQNAELAALEVHISDLLQYIPVARVAYVREFNRHKETWAVGLEFVQLDQKTEQGLVKILNKMMYEKLKKERPDFEEMD